MVETYEAEFAPRNFCGNCGSALYDDLGDNYFVAAGLMRQLDLTPAFHLQVAYKAPWDRSATTSSSSTRTRRPELPPTS